MLPPNTVPITAEELKQLPKYCLVWGYIKPLWACNLSDAWVLDGCSEYRIAAHDYRHYFGEVVDLASKMNEEYLDYLGCDFRFEDDETVWRVRDTATSLTQFKGTEQACKQWLIDHFTAIAAKDLPNYNLKFIFL